jgi:hypothetical protein
VLETNVDRDGRYEGVLCCGGDLHDRNESVLCRCDNLHGRYENILHCCDGLYGSCERGRQAHPVTLVSGVRRSLVPYCQPCDSR